MGNLNPREGTARAARAALGAARLSVAELARRTGRSHAYWSKRLDASSPMTVDDLADVAAETGVPITSLLAA